MTEMESTEITTEDFERAISNLPNLKKAKADLRAFAKQIMSIGLVWDTPRVVRDLYPEIKEARLIGVSWTQISHVLSISLGVKLHHNALAQAFKLLDGANERETGEPRAPVRSPVRKYCSEEYRVQFTEFLKSCKK